MAATRVLPAHFRLAAAWPRLAAGGASRWPLRTAVGVRRFNDGSGYPAPREGVPWGTFGFSLTTKDTKMVMSKCERGGYWSPPEVEPYGPLQLEPAATIINYGQGIFEGVKAMRTMRGRIVLFRPQKNAQRFNDGARRFLMPPVPSAHFLEACCMAVRENAEWVPPCGQGALYLRPLLFGSGADLGVGPSSEYMFTVFVAPVGKYFKGTTAGARMKLVAEENRSAPAGVGHIKAAGNYAQCFQAQQRARGDGFSDVIYMDVAGKYIEEAAASNFFCVGPDRVIHTPQLGSILPGVTRDSIVRLAYSLKGQKLKLNVGPVDVETVMTAEEAFVSGTGAGLTPIEHIASEQGSINLPAPGPVTKLLQDALTDIQLERVEDPFKWLMDPWQDPLMALDSFQPGGF